MVGESGITTLGVIWGQYLTSGIAGKLYVTSTPEQNGPSPLLTQNASCQRAAIGQMGTMIIIPSRISRSEYDTMRTLTRATNYTINAVRCAYQIRH